MRLRRRISGCNRRLISARSTATGIADDCAVRSDSSSSNFIFKGLRLEGELLLNTMKADADVGFGQTGDLGDFAVAQPVKGKKDQGAVDFRQFLDAGVEPAQARVLRFFRERFVALQFPRIPPARTFPVQCAIEGDAVDVG